MTKQQVLNNDFAEIHLSMGKDLEVFSGTSMLVTGAYGFVLSYFVDFIHWLNLNYLEEPCNVTAVDNLLVGQAARLRHLVGQPDIELVTADICTYNLRPQGYDWVVYGASVASPVLYRKHQLQTVAANVLGLWRLLGMLEVGQETMEQLAGFLYMSSSEVYGDPAVVPTPESYAGNTPFVGPRACYDESKRMAETVCSLYADRLPVKVCRPSNIYGPGQWLGDGRVIPQLMNALVNDETFELFGPGTETRTFCYVADAVRQMIAVLIKGNSGEAYNIGTDNPEISMRNLLHIVGAQCGTIKVEERKDSAMVVDSPQRRCPDLTKINVLCISSRLWLAGGLRRTYEYYLAD